MKLKIRLFMTLFMTLFVLGCGGGGGSSTPANIPPTAEDDSVYTVENVSITHDITTNDTDSDGTIDVATVSITSNASHGTLNIIGTGEVMYVPSVNYSGNDSFSYTLKDDGGLVSNVAEVNITIDLDTDNDGIGNQADADDDNDSIPDVNETANGTDPLDSDSDDDGMDDGQEATNGTNPLSTDTDGDGLLDGVEGTLDADNDGILDALESNSTDTDLDGVPDQLDNENLNPNNDTDGDGISNADEVNNGTNPQNTDSDGDGQSDGLEGEVDSDGDGILDALESSSVDSDGDGVMDEEDAGNDDPHIGALVVQDACVELTDGVYAYEEWRSYDSPNDDKYVGESDFKELKINSSNVLHIKEDEYTAASTFTTSSDSSAANWVSATSSGFIVDMTTLSTTPIGDLGFLPANYTGCNSNVASFDGHGGLLGYDIHINGRDISGEFILDIYPDLELEIADSATTPTKTFPMGSKLLVGEIVLTKDHYFIDEDSDTQVTDGIGNAFATIDWNTVSTLGQVFKYDDYNLTIVNDGTLTLVDDNDGTTYSGTWVLVGSGATQYLQTTITNNPEEGEPFLAVLNGALRYGMKFESGFSIHMGTEPDDVMDEVMFNKVAMEEIQTYVDRVILKKTGQTKSYDDSGTQVGNDSVGDGTLKDDGYYQKGVTPHYTRDVTTQIVTDHITGLMWQDDADAMTVTKPWVTQVNYDAGSYMDTSGDTATTYCENLTLGLYADWRLPSLEELGGIVDYSSVLPAMDTAFVNVASGYYWSSTTYAGGTSHAWSVNFYYGYQNYGNKGNNHYVRCVRAGQ